MWKVETGPPPTTTEEEEELKDALSLTHESRPVGTQVDMEGA
jgi:hypothetical protein